MAEEKFLPVMYGDTGVSDSMLGLSNASFISNAIYDPASEVPSPINIASSLMAPGYDSFTQNLALGSFNGTLDPQMQELADSGMFGNLSKLMDVYGEEQLQQLSAINTQSINNNIAGMAPNWGDIEAKATAAAGTNRLAARAAAVLLVANRCTPVAVPRSGPATLVKLGKPTSPPKI